MKPFSTREIGLMLDQAIAQNKKGEIFRVHSKRERNNVLTLCDGRGLAVITKTVSKNVFQVVFP